MPNMLKLPPRVVFAEFSRIDDDERIVEGYCFVNEDAGDGYFWERSAMEAATADYMRYGALREMHGRSAAGTAFNGIDELGITWDEKGAFIRAKVVDDAAWKKVKERVYKGFSCGIVPARMTKKRVTACVWPEVSLVDRPQDKDADISTFRAAMGLEAEYEVELDEAAEAEELARASFAEYVKSRESQTLRYAAMDWLSSSLWDISNGSDADKETLAKATVKQFSDYIVPIVSGGKASRSELPELARLVALTDEQIEQMLNPVETDMVTRLEYEDALTRLEAERLEATQNLTEVLTRAELAEAKVKQLEQMPAGKPLAKNGSAVAIDRTFLVNQMEAESKKTMELQGELQRLSSLPEGAPSAERMNASVRISAIRRELGELGVSA